MSGSTEGVPGAKILGDVDALANRPNGRPFGPATTPSQAGAVDWGLVVVLVFLLMLLLALPVGWLLWRMDADASPQPVPTREERQTLPDDVPPRSRLDLEHLRRELAPVPDDERALRDDLVRVRQQLDTLLLERVRSPDPKSWDPLIEDKRQEIARLEQNLSAMVSDGR